MRRIGTFVLALGLVGIGSASADPLLTSGNWKQRLSSRTGTAAPTENLYFRCLRAGTPDPLPRMAEIAAAQGCTLSGAAKLTQRSFSGSQRMTCTRQGTTLTVTYAGDPRTRFSVTYRYEESSGEGRASKTDVFDFIYIGPDCGA